MELVTSYCDVIDRYLMHDLASICMDYIYCIQKTYHPNGQINGVILIFDGKKEGEGTKYYMDGSLEIKCYFKNDLAHGEFIRWHPNGNVHLNRTFVEGKLNGISREWYLDGKIKYEIDYVCGVIHGMYIQYEEDGSCIKMPYANDKVEGQMILVSEENKIITKIDYVNDCANGKKYEYRRIDGTLERISEYKNDLRNGEVTVFYPDGHLEARSYYVEGKLEGISTCWHPNGQISRISYFHNDLEEGETKTFTETGILTFHSHHREGRKHGSYKAYYEVDGSLMIASEYVDDVLHGECIEYHDGKAIVTIYDHGVPLSIDGVTLLSS